MLLQGKFPARPSGALYLLWVFLNARAGRRLTAPIAPDGSKYMSRQFDGWKRVPAAASPPGAAVPLINRLTASPVFNELFREGMALVEEAAAYLDGKGRLESKALPRSAALAYATESMRLTTRLMQVASWLLLRRAVNEGDLTPGQALTERHRVKLVRQDLGCAPDIFELLPPSLRSLSQRSLRIQERIIHLDEGLLALARSPDAPKRHSEVVSQHERLKAAFSN
jgi:regulator of CtrA degradation